MKQPEDDAQKELDELHALVEAEHARWLEEQLKAVNENELLHQELNILARPTEQPVVGNIQFFGVTTERKEMMSLDTPPHEWEIIELDDQPEGGTEIVTQRFGLSPKSNQWRPIALRIPVETLWGFHQWGTDAQPTALALSALTWSEAGDVGEDNEIEVPEGLKAGISEAFDPDGFLEKGHLLPRASGAPQCSWLIAPMFQGFNKVSWKNEVEGLCSRLFQSEKGDGPAPQNEGENALATLLYAEWFKKADQRPWLGYVKVRLIYNSLTTPVPSGFVVTLHRQDGTKLADLASLPHVNPPSWEPAMSPGLRALFGAAHRLLAAIDRQRGIDGQVPWEPDRTSGPMFPEYFLPRPHRVLDLMLDHQGGLWLRNVLANGRVEIPYEGGSFLQQEPAIVPVLLHPYERALLEANLGQARMADHGFTEPQRLLAKLHNRFLHEGQFCSDLSGIETISGVRQNLTQYYFSRGLRDGALAGRVDLALSYYLDPRDLLEDWYGRSTPEGDHHVPKSERGSNYFTNLLFVSKHQNNREGAKNKPLWITNPTRVAPSNDDVGAGDMSLKHAATVKYTTVSKGIASRHALVIGSDLFKEKLAQWKPEALSVREDLLKLRMVRQLTYCERTSTFMPWDPRLKQKLQELKKIFK